VLPDPLHPAVVHLPIALAVLMPLFAVVALVAIAKGGAPARVWGLVLALQVLLTGSAWFAMETGEHEEERVEKVVEEHHIHEHHEAAEWFLYVAGSTAVLMAAGLLRDRPGRVARLVAAFGSVVVLATAARTGYLGGELVYRHGAGRAYTAGDTPGDVTPANEGRSSPDPDR
jgi:uncharacterized membrane protein